MEVTRFFLTSVDFQQIKQPSIPLDSSLLAKNIIVDRISVLKVLIPLYEIAQSIKSLEKTAHSTFHQSHFKKPK
jgi:hypothetical protein